MNEVSALNRTLITDLNDDCLYDIFKRLSVRDQLHLLKTCDRFHFIIKQMIWKNLFRVTRTNGATLDQLNFDEYREVFQHTTEFMEKLTVDRNSNLIFPREPGCKRICVELDFYLSFPFPRLTKFCSRDYRVNDGLVRMLAEKCPHLKELSLHSDFITGAHIKDMKELQMLHLPYCSTLKTEHVNDILERCVNITHLDLSGYVNVWDALRKRKPPKLRDIQVSKEEFHQMIANLEMNTGFRAKIMPGQLQRN